MTADRSGCPETAGSSPKTRSARMNSFFKMCKPLPGVAGSLVGCKVRFTGSNPARAPLMKFSPRGRADPEHCPPPPPATLSGLSAQRGRASAGKAGGGFPHGFLHPWLILSLRAEPEPVLGLAGGPRPSSGGAGTAPFLFNRSPNTIKKMKCDGCIFHDAGMGILRTRF